jgi:hypothetical protein
MCDQSGSCPSGGTELSAEERDDLATYLAAVSYPPARSRRIDDTLSTPATPVALPNQDGSPGTVTGNAHDGFSRFFVNNQTNPPITDPDTCADSSAGCHRLPLLTVTNSSTLNGFDSPTMRGLTDRWLQFSMAPTSAVEMMIQANTTTFVNIAGFGSIPIGPVGAQFQFDGTQGIRELTPFAVAFLLFNPVYGVLGPPIWQMVEEASTGYSGAIARQVPLNVRTTSGGELAQTDALMSALELADARGLVNLRVNGTRDAGAGPAVINLSYRSDGTYKNSAQTLSLTHAQLIAEAQAGTSNLTLVGSFRSGQQVPGTGVPQPLLAVGTGTGVTGDPPLPQMSATGGDPGAFTVVGTDVRSDGVVFLDGAPMTGATLACSAGTTGSFCNNGNVAVDLPSRPAAGLHLLQVLNPTGPISNELPICVGTQSQCR